MTVDLVPAPAAARPTRDAPRRVSAEALSRLARLAERSPRVALLGEFSAGKSSLLNLLLGRDLAPTQVTATHMPPCWYRSDATVGREERALAIDHDGTRRPIALGALAHQDPERCARVELALHAVLPGDVTIGDIPGGADPMLGRDDLERAARRAEIAVWCTPAPQAWRRSEQGAWLSLPRRLRRRAILAVTQADRLSPEDLDRVLTRLGRETEGLFGHVVALATPLARRAGQARAGEDWMASGAAALVAAIEAEAADVRAVRRAAMRRYALREAAPLIGEATVAAVVVEHDRTEPPGRRYAPGRAPLRHETTTAQGDVGSDGTGRRDSEEGITMKDQITDISALGDIRGFVGACLVDGESGLMLGSVGGGALDLETAGAGNTEVVRAKLEVMRNLGLDDTIEDILITLGTQFHLIRPLEHNPQVFLYLALDKRNANLGMARMALKKVEQQLHL